MADCSKKIERVPVQTFEDKVVGVTLDLSLEEAGTIYDVLGRVGGSPEGTRRKHADKIRAALDGHYQDFKHTREVNGHGNARDLADAGSLYFQR